MESKFILKARLMAGLTQADVSLALGYDSAQLVSNIERGICALPPAKIKAFAKITKSSGQALIDAKLIDHLHYLQRFL